jgi:hypothetical protein
MDVAAFRRQQRSVSQRGQDLAVSAADASTLTGRFLVNNLGEAQKTLLFPVKFSDIPLMTFSYEILDNVNIIEGRLPMISAQVADWSVVDRLPASRFYVGATVRVVATGPANTKFVVHWTAQGVAFSNPVGLL